MNEKPIDLKKAWEKFLKRQAKKRRSGNAGTKEVTKSRG